MFKTWFGDWERLEVAGHYFAIRRDENGTWKDRISWSEFCSLKRGEREFKQKLWRASLQYPLKCALNLAFAAIGIPAGSEILEYFVEILT